MVISLRKSSTNIPELLDIRQNAMQCKDVSLPTSHILVTFQPLENDNIHGMNYYFTFIAKAPTLLPSVNYLMH